MKIVDDVIKQNGSATAGDYCLDNLTDVGPTSMYHGQPCTVLIGRHLAEALRWRDGLKEQLPSGEYLAIRKAKDERPCVCTYDDSEDGLYEFERGGFYASKIDCYLRPLIPGVDSHE